MNHLARGSSRRGAAMLIALMVLAAMTSLGAAALRSAAGALAEARSLADGAESARLVNDLAPVLLEWLAQDDLAILAPNRSVVDPGHAPRWPLVFSTSRDRLEVQVRAIDLSGRLRIDMMESFARLGLPESLQTLDLPEHELPPPYEQLAREAVKASPGSDVRGFPAEDDGEAAVSIADWLTVRGSGALNVNTAPAPLLKAALAGAPPDAVRRLMALRRTDAPATSELLHRLRGPSHDRAVKRVPLTDQSDAVGFMISVRHGGALRRWWIAAERDGAGLGGEWRIVEQRRIAS